MELRHLRYFLAVADALHFGRAARSLHVSQPTVSQQIRQLEEELGAPLFHRLDRKVRLTEAGETFRAFAARALEDVDAGRRALAGLTALETGVLRVGHVPSLVSLVVPALAAVRAKWPSLRVIAVEAVTRKVERQLVEGKLDVGLGFSPARAPEIEAEPVLEGRLALIVTKKQASARVSARSLSGEPIALLAPGMRVRGMIDAFLASTRSSPRVVFEANAVATLLAAVRAGIAPTILPASTAGEGLVAVPLSPSPQTHFAALLFRRGAPRSPAAEAFASTLLTPSGRT
ncbi:MAG: LysR substrate-binding domain-containing protein [Polyangiales bacterium]